MSKVWKPTPEDCKTIRNYAKAKAGTGWVTLELGERISEDMTTASPNWNLLPGDHDASDLSDFISWPDFKAKGVPLDDKGDAYLDFYVHDRTELNTNVGVTIKDGQIYSMQGVLGAEYFVRAKA